jgi:aminoglycoside phosphotransferase (APT) family kinase protein
MAMTSAERHAVVCDGSPLPTWMHNVVRAALGASAHLEAARAHALAGGVSSDIYRVTAGGVALCVKRALPKLKTAADWQAPVERNRYEAAWMATVARIVPGAVPRLLAEDPDAGAFAMSWLPPERYPVWKAMLAGGAIEPADAAGAGDVLGRIHAATADRADVASAFATDSLFEAIRIEPYLLATAAAHHDLAHRLQAIAHTTRTSRRALVHGDFSPKNLLMGPAGPVVLDAECAWYGDPAFDLAFVLNHLLLKGAWYPQWRARYGEAFAALADAYRAHAGWEPWAGLERRAAALLPALMLARVDGKSPVEYLTEAGRDAVRRFARPRVAAAPEALSAIVEAWSSA